MSDDNKPQVPDIISGFWGSLAKLVGPLVGAVSKPAHGDFEFDRNVSHKQAHLDQVQIPEVRAGNVFISGITASSDRGIEITGNESGKFKSNRYKRKTEQEETEITPVGFRSSDAQ